MGYHSLEDLRTREVAKNNEVQEDNSFAVTALPHKTLLGFCGRLLATASVLVDESKIEDVAKVDKWIPNGGLPAIAYSKENGINRNSQMSSENGKIPKVRREVAACLRRAVKGLAGADVDQVVSSVAKALFLAREDVVVHYAFERRTITLSSGKVIPEDQGLRDAAALSYILLTIYLPHYSIPEPEKPTPRPAAKKPASDSGSDYELDDDDDDDFSNPHKLVDSSIMSVRQAIDLAMICVGPAYMEGIQSGLMAALATVPDDELDTIEQNDEEYHRSLVQRRALSRLRNSYKGGPLAGMEHVDMETFNPQWRRGLYKVLPLGSMSSQDRAIPTKPPMDPPMFCASHVYNHIPVVLAGGCATWPAIGRWKDPLYINRVAGTRIVPVEVGDSYLSESKRVTTVGEMAHLMLEDLSVNLGCLGSLAPHTTEADRESPDLLTWPLKTDEKAYLAQHNLLDQVPRLMADISVPNYCQLEGEMKAINVWIGPPDMVTPLHYDPSHNLLAQVVGRKYVRLISPKFSDCLYPFPPDSRLSNASQVDIRSPDLLKFPRYEEVEYLECMLGPGDMLYIPPGWWHYVHSLDTSFSVSFWWM